MDKSKSNGNGTAPKYVEDLAQLTARRTEPVNISEDEDQPLYVLVRAMSGGEKRRFLARETMPDPDDHLARIVDFAWRTGEKDRALLALCAVKQDGHSPLYPQARDRALRILAVPDGEDWSARVDGDPDPDRIDDLDPAIAALLLDAADRLTLLSTGAWQGFVSGPLARRNAGFSGGALASIYRTPSAPGTS